jgi:hypothetical protein
VVQHIQQSRYGCPFGYARDAPQMRDTRNNPAWANDKEPRRGLDSVHDEPHPIKRGGRKQDHERPSVLLSEGAGLTKIPGQVR